jgi:hydrogenase small subunit
MPGFTDVYEPFYLPLQSPRLPATETLIAVAGGAALLGVAGAYLATRGVKKEEEKK